jgi:hypothetical protein
MRTLAVRPQGRFQTVKEFQDIVSRGVDPPPPPPPPPRRWAVFAVAASILFIAVAFVFSLNWNPPVTPEPPTTVNPPPPPPPPQQDDLKRRIKELIARAVALLEKNEITAAISVLEDALKLDPSNRELQNKLADAQRKCDSWQQVFRVACP